MDRRNFFQNSALVTTGALAGCALPGVAQNQPKTPFSVPATYIPIEGSDEMFPVRRIYCIGRNYAAHAREIYLQAGRSHAMPPGNITDLSPEERKLLVAWYETTVEGK